MYNMQLQRIYLYKCSNGTSRHSCQYKHICFKADSVTWCEIHSLVHYYIGDGTWIELTCSNSTALLENLQLKPYTQLTIDTLTLQSQKTAAGKKPRKPKWRSSKSEMALLQVGELLLIDYMQALWRKKLKLVQIKIRHRSPTIIVFKVTQSTDMCTEYILCLQIPPCDIMQQRIFKAFKVLHRLQSWIG